ncbi:MAG TPA: ABC transporter ATP-binding protein [Bacteroidetes bacterium]|nr:ABC transporter ATP-binding protein [Bacteroidota bacterium]
MIKLEKIEKNYKHIRVLKSIDLEINEKEVISIQGASGAGKSTLLHIMGTLEKADKGNVYFNGENIASFSSRELARVRNQNIGFVFQFHHLLPEFTALENISIPAMIAKKGAVAIKKRAEELLDFMGLEDRMHHKPNQLSGGEQQRVAVARALVNEPAIVFADEPSGNLDTHNANDLHKLFLKLRDEMGQTFVIATHNRELASMSNKKYFLDDGIISMS